MNLREAANVAWHIRVNGLEDVKPEHIKGAMDVLEKLAERESLVQELLSLLDCMAPEPVALVENVKRVRDFKIGCE